MDFSTFLTIIATAIGIISTLLVGAIWVLTITSKLSNRAIIIERDVSDTKKRVDKLETETSFSALKNNFSEIVFQVLNSKEFKETNKEIIRDTMLHIEKNRTLSESSAFQLILEKLENVTHEKS